MVGLIKKMRSEQRLDGDEIFGVESGEEPLAEGTTRTKAGICLVCSGNSMEEARAA